MIGARPRTLPAAVVPVAVGAAARWVRVGRRGGAWRVALVVSLALQVGVNYANDYSDGVRGHRRRAGRPGAAGRLGAGAAGCREAGGVRGLRRRRGGRAGAGGRHELVDASPSGWRPSPRRGSTPGGRARTGTPGWARCSCSCSSGWSPRSARRTWPSSEVTGLSVLMGCAAGCLACALLVVNNLRDIPSDTTAGKRTLAVRLGDARTRWMYVGAARRGVRARSSSPRLAPGGAAGAGSPPCSPCRRSGSCAAAPAARP